MQELEPKKRILFVITKSVWGGAGKYVYDLAVNLPKENFEIAVAAGGQNELAEKIKLAGIKYYEIKNFKRDVGIIKDLLSFFEIFKTLKKFGPDILHTNSSKAGAVAGAAFFVYKIFKRRVMSVFTAHGWAFNEKRPRFQIFLIKLTSKITSFFYDKIICVSEFDAKTAIENKIAPKEKLTVIHNGINADDKIFLEKEEAIKKLNTLNHKLETVIKNSESGNIIIIGTVGEFTKNKGQKYLIEAVAKIKNDNVKCLIIGWGEEISNLKSQISNLKSEDKIFLIEGLSPATPYLKAFDIFVLPSLKEGLPYTLLEAGLAELPVIATNVGGNPEIIESEETGTLIQPANADDIAKAIEDLINNPEIAKKLALNLRKKILQRFSLENLVKKTVAIYGF